jgi:hypothetical protein
VAKVEDESVDDRWIFSKPVCAASGEAFRT